VFADWQELGFGKGYHVWRVTILLSFIYPVIYVFALFAGQTTIVALLISIGVNFFLDGFTEETLFRGVIFTRMTQLFGVAWGVGISGLLFGLGHISTTMHTLHNNLPLALSFVMVHFVLNGMFAAFFFLCTRNLTAMVISHTLGDAAIPFLSF
jgi:membrane protease YdiL (CAAX protease family)